MYGYIAHLKFYLQSFSLNISYDHIYLEGSCISLHVQEHAKKILDLLQKDVSRGVIPAAETADAIGTIEREIEQDVPQVEGENDQPDSAVPVSFATRVYPFFAMLRAAHAGGHDILW